MPVPPKPAVRNRSAQLQLAVLEKMAKQGVGAKSLHETKRFLAAGGRGKGSTKSKALAPRSPEFRFYRSIFPLAEDVSSKVKPDYEKATRLIFILDLAQRAFGDRNLARAFLFRRHPKLKTTPIAKLETEWGGREVEQILNAMMFGLPY